MVSSPFKIYNASAGSGKTFSLVKEYLKVLFQKKAADYYKQILAITFTNKAVAEMKARIIDTLKAFSNKDILSNPNDMFIMICEELNAESETIHTKSKDILNSIIYNYAGFEISTIDGFTHKLIRTFAFDLNLAINFEVELDQDLILIEAVDSLISKAGSDKLLTKTLIDFAIEKTDDDKSWDISLDFYKVAKLLLNENDKPFLETIKNITPEDFKNYKTHLIKQIQKLENDIIKQSEAILTLIEESGLQFDDFSRSSLPNHFKNLAGKKFTIKFDNNWQHSLINGETLYPKRVTEDIASVIEDIQPQLILAFNKTKTEFYQYKLTQAIYRNLTPLSVLNAINLELIAIKTEENKLLISEFNSIISKEIKDQPTPFIYERIGEKFKHYFIDEFQDTSVLQWENLVPLLNNSLSTENGSALLVGDAKQAIYRWRGGKAEQFIDLYNETVNPFFVNPYLERLPANYRSSKEIVNFNNAFFKYLSESVFSETKYADLYQNAKQDIIKEQNGYVNVAFLEFEKQDDETEIYCQEILKTITNCKENGFALEDICILVRKKKQEKAIADFLSANRINIVSSETLLLQNSPSVNFINAVFEVIINPNNAELKVEILDFLAKHFSVEDKHQFFQNHVHLTNEAFFTSFSAFNIHLNYQKLTQLSLYDMAEVIVREFNLVEKSNAYIQFYLDVVLEFFQKKGSNISQFLDYFNKKEHSLSIVSPKRFDALQIMTIHKAKGLEFPVVIFPFADIDIYKELEPKEWLPLNAEKNNGFPYALLNYNKDFENYNDLSLAIYNKHQSELELDNINLLYVALTRPIQQLHIISKYEEKPNTKNTYSAFLINFLEQKNAPQKSYSFGNQEKQQTNNNIETTVLEQDEFITTSKESHHIKIVTSSGKLWDTTQQKAIEKGNLIHDIMSQIKTKADVDFVLNDYKIEGVINAIQSEKLKIQLHEIIEHTELQEYYTSENTIYTERDIISKQGIILRPDRLVINQKNEATIIDYKTGQPNKSHNQQLQIYQDVLEEMNFKVTKKILVYINDDIQVNSIN